MRARDKELSEREAAKCGLPSRCPLTDEPVVWGRLDTPEQKHNEFETVARVLGAKARE